MPFCAEPNFVQEGPLSLCLSHALVTSKEPTSFFRKHPSFGGSLWLPSTQKAPSHRSPGLSWTWVCSDLGALALPRIISPFDIWGQSYRPTGVPLRPPLRAESQFPGSSSHHHRHRTSPPPPPSSSSQRRRRQCGVDLIHQDAVLIASPSKHEPSECLLLFVLGLGATALQRSSTACLQQQQHIFIIVVLFPLVVARQDVRHQQAPLLGLADDQRWRQ